jgi:hypothetical protein
MLTASCHCGALRIEVPRKPRTLTDCNCSICRHYGTLWAYYSASRVRVIGSARAKSGYSWGGKRLRFVRCKTCGCVTHWEPVQRKKNSYVGVNWRNFEPGLLDRIRIRLLDGAGNWKARYTHQMPHGIA